MAPTKMKLRVRKKPSASTKSSQQVAPRPETSPDSKCPICLDRFVNVASVERCLHRFCFRCIREWARNKAECPLCKQPFRSIFHSVRAENDFKEYVVLESSAENATTSAPATVTNSTATVVTPPAAPYDLINSTSRTRRSRATRSRGRRSQTAQDSTASGSTVNEVALQRLLPWLQRDRVMGGTPNELHPFLLARTLHELMSFARSIEAMQCPPAPSYEEDSGSQSSIINISEDDDGEEVAITENIQVESVSTVPVATGGEISLSQSGWDDDTPGPSYSTLSQLPSEPGENSSGGTAAASTEQRDRNGIEDEEDEDECMIVGYVKPMAERTPELVQLSSDSTEEGEGEGNDPVTVKTPDGTKVEPTARAPPSPKSYPSTSQTENLPSQQRTAEAPRGRGFRTHSVSDSSVQSGLSGKASLHRTRERKRRGQRALGRSSSSSSEDLHTSFPLWDSPERHKSRDDRKRKRRIKRRDRNKERSRSPHHHGNQTLTLRSSSSSADSRPEKPAGKRKYKTRHLERNGQRQSAGRTRERVRERSPSVEIIFERRSSDAQSQSHRWRRSRHKKRSRRKNKVQNSPTVITIDSDSSSDHNRAEEGHGVDYQEPLTEDYLTDYKCSKNQNDRKDKLTAFLNQLTDSQDQSSGSPDPSSPPKGGFTQNRGHAVDIQRGATDCPAKVNYKHWVNADSLHGDGPEPVPGDDHPPSDCKDHQPKHNSHSSSVDPGSEGERHTADRVVHGPNANSGGSDCVEPTSGKNVRIADFINRSSGSSARSAECGGEEENRRRADVTPCLSAGDRHSADSAGQIGGLTDSRTHVRAPSSEHNGPDAEISADTNSYLNSDEPLDFFETSVPTASPSATRPTDAPLSGKVDDFDVDQRDGHVSHGGQSERESMSGVQDDDDTSSDV